MGSRTKPSSSSHDSRRKATDPPPPPPPQPPPVYSRDFAYPDNQPVLVSPGPRMARSSIRDASAPFFAEYVLFPFISTTSTTSSSITQPVPNVASARAFRTMSAFIGSPARSHLWFAIGAGEVVDGQKESSEAKTLRKRLLAGPTVDIFVGSERRHWTLHRNLLCHHSSYFETEFVGHEVPRKGKGGAGAGTDGAANELELPDDDPRGFELLVKWLYQGSLEDASGMTDMEKYEHAVACHKLYVLCDKFDMALLKNMAMDRYRRELNAAQLVPDPDEINDIYRASPAGSPFRKLMTNIAARQIMDPEVDKDADSYRKCFENNADFAVEMVNSIRSLSGGMLFDDPTEGDVCEYHDHRDGRKCHSKGKAKGMMRRITSSRMSVDIRNPQQQQHQLPPRTPRKVRINPPSPSLAKSTPRKQPAANGAHASSGSPESTRSPSGFANGGPNLSSAKEASKRMNSASLADNNFVSPRKLPDDRFNSIVKQLNHASTKGSENVHRHSNGVRSIDEVSVGAGSEGGKSALRKPRKLSVTHHQNHSEGLGNGVNGHKG